MDIGWSADEIVRRQNREAYHRRQRLMQQYEGVSLKEARAADDRKRLEEYHAFCRYKEEILRRDREKRREHDVGY